MDVGNKTLSQLSEEAKEKRYVSLETGAKISGYTKEYLERLCRMNKVEYRMWNHGEFVIELESLLAETHAILLSYEDINFVEKSLLAPAPAPTSPVPTVATAPQVSKTMAADEAGRILSEKVAEGIAQPVPTFGASRAFARVEAPSPFARVGQMVVSHPLERNANEEVINKKVVAPAAEGDLRTEVAPTTPAPPPAQPSAPTGTSVVVPTPEATPVAKKPLTLFNIKAAVPTHVEPPQPKHVPIVGAESSLPNIPVQPRTLASVIPKAKTEPGGIVELPSLHPDEGIEDAETPAVRLNVKREHVISVPIEAKNDAWDAMLFGDEVAKEETVAPAAPSVPSPYHPIQTSVDATLHHEVAPLFPPLGGVSSGTSTAPRSAVSTMAPPQLAPVQTKAPAPVSAASALPNETRSGIPDLGENKRVVVFMPEKFSNNKGSGEKAVSPKAAEASVAAPPVFKMPIPMAVPQAPRTPAPKSVQAIVLATPVTPAIQLTTSVTEAPHAPLPANLEEHHMILREKYPLAKSAGFNVSVLLFLIATSVITLGGFGGGTNFVSNSASYVAGVGAAFTREVNTDRERNIIAEPSEPPALLPFSDELNVATGTAANTFIVQPIFRDGVGSVHQYVLPGVR